MRWKTVTDRSAVKTQKVQIFVCLKKMCYSQNQLCSYITYLIK